MIDKSIESQINEMVDKAENAGLANGFDQPDQPMETD